MKGKCPACGMDVHELRLSEVSVRGNPLVTWRGVTYNCPHCNVVLSASIDPVALRTEIMTAIARLKER